MPDCACVLRVQGGLEVGRWGAGKGEPAPSPKPLGNKIPTLSAAVWQGYARQGFSEKEDGAWSQALPPPPTSCQVSGPGGLSVQDSALVGGRGQCV